MVILAFREQECLNGTTDLWRAGKKWIIDPKTRRPSTSETNVNIEKILQLVYGDHRLIIRIMANELGIAKETIRTILVENLGMQKVHAKMVPWILTPEQKARCPNVCQDIF